jgi:DNA-directed RNA polymerase subunit RPC12/RpoP
MLISLYKTKAFLLVIDNMDHIFTFKMIVLSKKPNDGGTFFSKDNLPQSKKMDPFFAGKGPLNYNCGQCDHPLLKSIRRIQITDATYKCPKCGSFNRVKV